LEDAGATVIMTRGDDGYVSLTERVTIANAARADIFVSVHLNSVASPAPEGTVTLYYGRAGQYEDAQGRRLAEAIQASLSQKLETSDKLWTRVWRDHDLRGFHLYVLANTNMPAVITESVFISNPSEQEIIALEYWQCKAAEGHYRGILAFFEQYPCGVVQETLTVSVKSPVSLRVYDSANRVTGLIDSEIRAEIPGSSYNPDTNQVTIIPAIDMYRIEIHGYDEGVYTLEVALYDEVGATHVEVKDVRTSRGEIHHFDIDWEALAKGEKGITITIDEEVINTSIPNTPSAPTPTHQATDVAVDTALSWTGGDDADPEKEMYYQIYFSTELFNLPLSLEEVIGPFPADQTSITHELQLNPGQLEYDTTYYWQIVAVDEYGITSEGPIWSFTTITNPLQTETIIDFEPDVLNLKIRGKFVTVYIELPEGFDVGQIDVSSIRLKDTIPALGSPTEIGDYNDNSIPDLMVKFDLASVKGVVEAGESVETTVTGEVGGLQFKGTDIIRVIGL
jgi:hypothetical protein